MSEWDQSKITVTLQDDKDHMMTVTSFFPPRHSWNAYGVTRYAKHFTFCFEFLVYLQW